MEGCKQGYDFVSKTTIALCRDDNGVETECTKSLNSIEKIVCSENTIKGEEKSPTKAFIIESPFIRYTKASKPGGKAGKFPFDISLVMPDNFDFNTPLFAVQWIEPHLNSLEKKLEGSGKKIDDDKLSEIELSSSETNLNISIGLSLADLTNPEPLKKSDDFSVN